jgi:thymidylate synthase ThyX
MAIKAQIIKDSIATNGRRVTTFLLYYPRFIHAEVMTHRAFSRNSSSSRAIPFEQQVEAIKREIAAPIEYRANKSGMQAGGPLSERAQSACQFLWKEAALKAIQFATDLHLFGVHKQYASRLLEPFMHISVVITATDFANFFALRYHEMAQPEILELARVMWEEYSASVPILKRPGEWHLPFVSEADYEASKHDQEKLSTLIRRSVACCARTSYKNHDKSDSTDDQNDALYRRLVGQSPMHASPAEHQAFASVTKDDKSANFTGWIQYRQTLPGQKVEEFQPPAP